MELLLFMPDLMWFSIGFGPDMYDIDMLAWHADGDNSYFKDYWSTKKDTPGEDSEQNLTGRSKVFAAGAPAGTLAGVDYKQIAFLTYRPLDTGDTAEDFLVQLGREMDMVYALRLRDSSWSLHDRRGEFKMTLDESMGNPAVEVAEQQVGVQV
jgi:hypothetical protein